MTHDELVALIRGGVTQTGGTWADFGAGAGNFTRALRDLLGEHATLYAIDRNGGALRRQQPDVNTITADFTRPIPALPPLDGLLVANALHFTRKQTDAVAQLQAYLKPGGVFLIVEYEVRLSRAYIPFPVPYQRFKSLAQSVGLTAVAQVGSRKSPSDGKVMYAARAIKAAD